MDRNHGSDRRRDAELARIRAEVARTTGLE
jgi:hypothetical protein